MTQRNDDDLLREAFQDLRRDTHRRGAVPDVRAMLDRARAEVETGTAEPPATRVTGGRDTSWLQRGGWLSLAAAAAVVGLMLVGGPASQADREFERLVAAYSTDVSAGAWSSPTDALLRTPGIDLGAVPTFGSSLGRLAPRPETPQETDLGRDS